MADANNGLFCVTTHRHSVWVHTHRHTHPLILGVRGAAEPFPFPR